jgi:DNA modification methylase
MSLLDLTKLNNITKVQGFTHNFYRYPARFSPEFAREIIEKFTQPSETVLDIFMGGGTTIVEAIAAGRRAIGVDINSLSYFITSVKTTPISLADKDEILTWLSIFKNEQQLNQIGENEALVNLPKTIRDFLVIGTNSLGLLRFPRQRNFVKCALLKVGQWSVDFRESPSMDILKFRLSEEVMRMFSGLDSLVEVAKSSGIYKNKITNARLLINHPISSNRSLKRISGEKQKPDIILTSPPYPGVHVLYHRWQIAGRKETPAPYWVTGLQDGKTEPYYTMGGRSEKGLETYFKTMTGAFYNLKSVLKPSTTVIQLVGFSDKETQLPKFLNAMNLAGYEEIFPVSQSNDRLTRNVPNRKWYTRGSTTQDSSQETLLFHRLRN